jgi:hypothetical protein
MDGECLAVGRGRKAGQPAWILTEAFFVASVERSPAGGGVLLSRGRGYIVSVHVEGRRPYKEY